MSVTSTIWVGPSAAPGCAPEPLTFSRPFPLDLMVYRGDSGRFRVHVQYVDGTPINISGAAWDCDVRATVDTATPITSLTVTPIDTSTVEVVITPTQSALLTDGAVWDLEMTLGTEVQTLLRGSVFLVKDVSR